MILMFIAYPVFGMDMSVKCALPIAVSKAFIEVVGADTIVFIDLTTDEKNSAGWFSVPPDQANPETFSQYISQSSCRSVKIGDTINLKNSAAQSTLIDLNSWLKGPGAPGIAILPIVNTDKYDHPEKITGFVHIKVLQVQVQGERVGVICKVENLI